ncbi:MAG TPA: GNAT family N-acetyltransferase [Terriglobales bacterium]|nr:GNAT family N-acetyltransferase [Terriglobales bacterium]
MRMALTTALPILQPAWDCVRAWPSALAPWDELQYASATEPWMSWSWLRTWWECYGGSNQLRLWHWRQGKQWIACLPLMREYRHGLRQLRGLGGAGQRRSIQCHPASLSQGGPSEWAATLASALRRQRDWDVLQLDSMPVAEARLLQAACREQRLPAMVGATVAQRYIPLDRPWPEVTAHWGASLYCNVVRRERGLRKLGALELVTVTDPEAAVPRFEECLAIEASGWKGRAGTAMLSNPLHARFYRALVRTLAEERRLRLMLLCCDHSIIAFRLCTQQHGALAGVKAAYAEAWRKHSPGMVMLHLMLRQAHQSGLNEYDFLGGDDQFKRDWTPFARPLTCLRVFNSTPRGRLAGLAVALRRRLRRAPMIGEPP